MSPPKEIKRDEIQIVGGSSIKVSDQKKKSDKSSSDHSKENNNMEINVLDSILHIPSSADAMAQACHNCGYHNPGPSHQRINSEQYQLVNQGFVQKRPMTIFWEADRLAEELSQSKFVEQHNSQLRKTTRSTARKKDGEEEFFNMTYLS